jgi:hypothetical protein
MTVELVLILIIWASILLGVFFGDVGPIETFKKSGPRLAARIEKNLATGRQFKRADLNAGIEWQEPPK